MNVKKFIQKCTKSDQIKPKNREKLITLSIILIQYLYRNKFLK